MENLFLMGLNRYAEKTDLTRWEKPRSPALNLLHTNVKARTDHPTLVEPPIQLNHDLASPMIINVLKLANVAYRKEQLPLIHAPKLHGITKQNNQKTN